LGKTELRFLKNIGYKSFQYSLDTLNQKVSRKVLRNEDKCYIKKIISSIKYAENIGLKIGINCILNKYNYEYFGEFLKSILQFNNIYRLSISPAAYSLYKGKSMKKIMLTVEEVKKLVNDNKSIIELAKEKIDNFKAPSSDLCWGHNPVYSNEKEFWNRALCTGGRSGFIFLPDGKVTTCEELYWNQDYIIGDLKDQSIMEIAESEKRQKLLFPKQDDFPDNSPCKYCEVENFNKCHIEKGRCWRDSLKYFGKNKYPDPRCPFYKDIVRDYDLNLKSHEYIWNI